MIFQNFVFLLKNKNMTPKQIKKEISDVIDNIPDDVLKDVLEYLKSLSNKSKNNIQLSQNLSKILDEDKILLEKLAQ